EQVAGHQGDAVLEVGDPLEVHRAGAAHHADDLVVAFEEQLGEVAAVLAGDAGDESSLGHRERRYRVMPLRPDARLRAGPPGSAPWGSAAPTRWPPAACSGRRAARGCRPGAGAS